MLTRREVLQVAAATAAILPGLRASGLAQARISEDELLRFDPLGNVTLLHITDVHGQLVPIYFREPSINLGVGEARGLVPHLAGRAYLERFGIADRSAAAYALTADDFEALAKDYGRIGGLDRAATVVKRVRAERGDKVLLLDGGDTWQGSLGANRTRGQDMVDCFRLLKPDAMTGHWEFTYGEARVKDLVDGLGFPFLALNVRDTEWEEPVFEPYRMFEAGGVKIAVLGQAFPYTPVANPRWMIPKWSFGIREEMVRANVAEGTRRGRRARRAAVAQRLRRRSQARRARRRDRRDPHRPHPRRAARGDPGRQDAPRRLRQPRQIPLPARSRRARRRA